MSDQYTVTVQKLLSKQTVEKLDTAITKGNMEQLRKQMEKLFTFKNIFNMHDDHLIGLAECIIDIARAEDIDEELDMQEQYAHNRIQRYQERRKKIVKTNQWMKAAGNTDKVKKLDTEYQVWVYESGFQFSMFQMYSMICNIVRLVREYRKAGAK